MRQTPRAFVGVLIALLPLGAACTTTVRRHPDFARRMGGIHRVGVMPVEATVVRLNFAGDDEELHGVEREVERRLVSRVSEYVRRLDFETTLIEIDEATEQRLADIRFETTAVQQAADAVLAEAYETPRARTSEATRYRRSMGPQVNRFADLVAADALLFVRVEGFERSGGEVARNLVFAALIAMATLGVSSAVEPPRGAVLRACLVDGTTGDVLWAERVARSGGYTGRGLDSAVEKLLSSLRP